MPRAWLRVWAQFAQRIPPSFRGLAARLSLEQTEQTMEAYWRRPSVKPPGPAELLVAQAFPPCLRPFSCRQLRPLPAQQHLDEQRSEFLCLPLRSCPHAHGVAEAAVEAAVAARVV